MRKCCLGQMEKHGQSLVDGSAHGNHVPTAAFIPALKVRLSGSGKSSMKERSRRRNRYRFQEIRSLVGMEPVAGEGLPLSISVSQLNPVQSRLSVVRIAQLKPLKLVQTGLAGYTHIAGVELKTAMAEAPLHLGPESVAALGGYTGAIEPKGMQRALTSEAFLLEHLHARNLLQAGLLRPDQMKSVPFESRSEVALPVTQQAVAKLAKDADEAIQPLAMHDASPAAASLKTGAAATLWPFARDLSEVAVENDLSVSEKPELEDDPFYDSTIAIRDSARTGSLRTWRAIQQFFLGRRFSQAMVAIMVAVFVSTLNAPWRDWFSDHIESAAARIEVAISTFTQPIRERAAFFIVDDFEQGAEKWISEGSMTFDPGGLFRVNGMALREDTLNLESYRFDFDAKIETGAVGWAVRARDMRNYYAFKLVETKRQATRLYELHRYAVIDGVETADAAKVRIPVPGHLPKQDDFNRISMRVRGSQIMTLVNGWGVDHWRDSRLERGGVGFLAENGESSLISRVTVSGNDDTWGLILYGTIETLRSVRETVSPRVAVITLSPIPLQMLRQR